jgi:8-oxo-dGTP pyrophosphatase MutT (NUDIX family)
MVERGGRQRIPRPADARLGGPPAWAHLPAEARRLTLEDVRAAIATLPPPRRGAAPATARPAAVLVPIFEEAGEARIILTKRPETMPSHQGEIAFPGGKLEEAVDADLEAAALREAHEEIGLDPAIVEIVAELDSLTTVAGRFSLTPFVGLLDGRPRLRRDPTEVVAVFDVSISDLLDDLVYREERWDIPAGLGPEPGDAGSAGTPEETALAPSTRGGSDDRAIHFFELPGETVWGATARILVSFLEHLTNAR